MNDELRGILGELVDAMGTITGLPRNVLPYAVAPERVEGELPPLDDHAALARMVDGVLIRMIGMDLPVPVPIRGRK
jgi:hypothetical protein